METQAARKLDEPAGGSGLEPETILPSQFFDRFQIDASLQPEKRLMLAVLEDAVGTFQKYVTATGRRGQPVAHGGDAGAPLSEPGHQPSEGRAGERETARNEGSSMAEADDAGVSQEGNEG